MIGPFTFHVSSYAMAWPGEQFFQGIKKALIQMQNAMSKVV
jgi:hypothetical protein